MLRHTISKRWACLILIKYLEQWNQNSVIDRTPITVIKKNMGHEESASNDLSVSYLYFPKKAF